MTLSDVEYQAMRDDAKKVIRAVGVATGGSNIQFAVHPKTGRRIVIEMNPRVSRSSALASKATGFPIAKIAALLAVGYRARRDPERHHEEDARRPSSPTLDYVVDEDPALHVREVPRRRYDARRPDEVRRRGHGPRADVRRVFRKGAALARDRTRRAGWTPTPCPRPKADALRVPRPERIYAVLAALRHGTSVESISEVTGIDRWFLDRFAEALAVEARVTAAGERALGDADLLREAKRSGFSDPRPRDADGPPRLRRGGGPRAPVRHARLQPRRHVRGGVRVHDAVPLLLLRDRGRSRRHVEGKGHRPRLRAEPNRAGPRVRLLLRPRGRGDHGGGLRVRDGELQSRDRVDGLRHVRPPLLRAAHVRGRHGRREAREARRASSCSSAGRRRSSSHTRSRARACRSSGPSRRPSTAPKTESASASS